VDYSPSYLLYISAVDPSITISLGQGWYVNVPDYEGPLAAFTAGVQSGHATIDGVRACLNFGHGVAKDAKYALWGYSGGALASEWAAELQLQYAPHMKFAGVALGGLTPNATSVEETINNTPFAELVVNGILGLIAEDPAAEQYIKSQLKPSGPYNATTFLSALHQSTTADDAVFADKNIFNFFKAGTGILDNPTIGALIDRDSIMGYHGVPSMPVYAYKAINDEVSVVADTDALVNKFCGIGANILYQRNTVGGHIAEATNGAPAALQFIGAVLTGQYAKYYKTTGCTIQNVTVAIDPSPDR
jgi:Secretory lipase